jgi:hypothetical protein
MLSSRSGAQSSSKQLLKADEFSTIFGNIKLLLGINAALLHDLKARFEDFDPDTTLLADIILKMVCDGVMV